MFLLLQDLVPGFVPGPQDTFFFSLHFGFYPAQTTRQAGGKVLAGQCRAGVPADGEHQLLVHRVHGVFTVCSRCPTCTPQKHLQQGPFLSGYLECTELLYHCVSVFHGWKTKKWQWKSIFTVDLFMIKLWIILYVLVLLSRWRPSESHRVAICLEHFHIHSFIVLWQLDQKICVFCVFIIDITERKKRSSTFILFQIWGHQSHRTSKQQKDKCIQVPCKSDSQVEFKLFPGCEMI